MIKQTFSAALLAVAMLASCQPQTATEQANQPVDVYVPTPENLAARQAFADSKLGIFLHWGIYSMFAQGEWYLQNVEMSKHEYAKVADAFYPHRFNAKEWVSAIKASGAKYICFTTRHHDSFSMWDTQQSDFNIVDATPFGRDWPAYYDFMNKQLVELLTNYGEIGAIWFDGWWDHEEDTTPFDWQLKQQYAMIHHLQPSCLVGNNHHQVPFEGEDIQIFERDIPGQNTAGLSGQDISKLPLETCQTMNGMWGYKLVDQNYKSTETLIRYLVGTAGKGANLLLNVGPQPNGELPKTAIERMKEMGEWLGQYGDAVYGTTAGDVAPQEWGVTTRKGDRLFVHIMDLKSTSLKLPLTCKVKQAQVFGTHDAVKFVQKDGGIELIFDKAPEGIDYIVELITEA